MLDDKGRILYVGKAANLRKRVASYFGGGQRNSPRIRAMLEHVAGIEVTVTASEGEALLLENNLIKEHKPRYNVVFRDDKSYPYIYLSLGQDFPRLGFHRGARHGKGRYFGPYPSAGAVRQTLNLVQKLFRIRQCEDSFFRNRSRPCLQYQIQRCTAPCVGYIDKADYQRDVQHAVLFLEGKNEQVIEALTGPMQAAAAALDFERAAVYRDRIASLRLVQGQHRPTDSGLDLDAISCAVAGEIACVQVVFIRGGMNIGNKAYFPQQAQQASAEDVLSAFLVQYYLAERSDRHIPGDILASHRLQDTELLSEVLAQRAGHPVRISSRPRGARGRWLQLATDNARVALAQQLSRRSHLAHRLNSLQQLLEMEDPIERIECFDVSHSHGEATVAACVVYGTEGPIKSDYRRFNITDVTPGDDYAALEQAVRRRYTRVRREEGRLPDLLLIDGGKGQVSAVGATVEELQLPGLLIIGVAKGPARKPGQETLILSSGSRTLRLPPDSPALHLIQTVRDEAHRFAITGHRLRRGKARTHSPLEAIEGVGAKRRQQLLRHFGGLQGVIRASVEELARVPGIHKNLAHRIYESLHEDL
jgi:excinuclease ABC subunit C